MSDDGQVATHYTHGSLVETIRSALRASGVSPESATLDDLAQVDEFHIGGRQASEAFLSQLSLTPDTRVVDIGCGLGGAARYTAQRFGCHVTGIDLTEEFVRTGRTLTDWTGLGDRVELHVASALATPFDDAGFDAAYMMHVGMNIADKAALFAEVYRILKPGGIFGIYDVMQTGGDDLTYPVPWAENADISALATPQGYRDALNGAGFSVTAERNRKSFALEFFAQMNARMTATGGPPPLGIHILMGESRLQKTQNMYENISSGRIAPVEMTARKP